MFTNPFNKKYQDGGSAPTDDQKKEMQGFVTWIKSNVEGFKDKSEQEIAKSLSDMAKSDEGKKSVQDLYSRYQKSKKQKSKFEDGGKFQSFICKHGHGGVNCGCGGGKVVLGEEGLPRIDENNRIDNITGKKYQEVLPDGTIKQTLTKEEPDKTTSYTILEITPQQDSLFRTWNTRYGNDNINTYRPASQYRWYHKLNPFVSIAPNNWIESFKQNFVQSEEDGGILKGQDGLITSLNSSERNNRANRWTRREALNVAQAGNEDNPDRATLRKVYRGLKREGLENGLGWRARRDDARRRLVGGYDLNSEFKSAPTELILPSFEGPRKYTEGVVSTEGPVAISASTTKRTPRVVTPIPQQEGPSITDSIAAQKAFNDAWMQYQYERGIYNNRTGAYTAGQDGQAYMNWLYGDFKKNYDPTTGKMNSNWYWRQPTNEELKMYENTPYYGAILPGSAQARREYGIDLNNYRFLTPETMLVQTDPYELSAEQRRDIAKYPTTIGPGSNDIHGNIGKLMGSIIAGGYGANLANQLIAEIPELANGINTGDEALMSKVNRWIENNWKSLDGTKMRRPAYGNQKRNALGQFGNRNQGSWYYRGNRRIAGSEIGFKQGGKIEKPTINRFKNVLHK